MGTKQSTKMFQDETPAIKIRILSQEGFQPIKEQSNTAATPNTVCIVTNLMLWKFHSLLIEFKKKLRNTVVTSALLLTSVLKNLFFKSKKQQQITSFSLLT